MRVTGVSIGAGRREGKEIVFENPIEPDGKSHSFRFLPEQQVFMDHHRLAADMLVTPTIFVARCLGVSPKDAWLRLKKESGDWISNRRVYRSKSVLTKLGLGSSIGEWLSRAETSPSSTGKMPRQEANGKYCLQDLYSNLEFRRVLELRTDLLRELMRQCVREDFRCNPSAKSWLESRGFEFQGLADLMPDCVPLGLNPSGQLNSASEILGWNKEQRLLSGLWRADGDGQLQHNWVGYDYSVLFPVWTPIRHGCVWSYFVTGLRIRKTSRQNDSPKEVVLKPQGLSSTVHLPGSVGFSGLFRHNRGFEISPQQDVLDGCAGKTVVLTEGITDALAGDQLFRLEQPSLLEKKQSEVLFLSTGQIQTSSWAVNLRLLSKCRRLIIAFNNDSHKANNTGQENAFRLFELARKFGLAAVDLLPVECLEGCNDLNDLLRKRRKEIASGAPRGFLEFRNFSTFIGVNNDRK